MDSAPNIPPGTDEVVAVFDSAGRPVGSAARSRVYAEGLWHASAGVLVRSGDGKRLYVHRRSDTKTVFAGHHDCLAGGVVDPGETPEEAAARELAEELGVTGVGLTPIAAVAWDGHWQGMRLRCHLYAYETHWDGPIVHQASEIAAGWWWTPHELVTHLRDPQWPFVPDTRALLEDYLVTPDR
ncbi:NUDIX domain-containing protein [Rhodococcus opacus]|uniref:NUDIX domain-containing protein n=1 Tax=Rhodococcus opacus TaxID=37919 RepID=A0AAX3Y9M4_RHOOP|nr:NUDIX domain-containing protein [Rhodococcus opacus]MCZ4589382.1 NUDIX domain-containing protein [Rhodococcus opacus]WLF44895.1 NUDIX domain-containing protein [Rhodococcus opacus]